MRCGVIRMLNRFFATGGPPRTALEMLASLRTWMVLASGWTGSAAQPTSSAKTSVNMLRRDDIGPPPTFDLGAAGSGLLPCYGAIADVGAHGDTGPVDAARQSVGL